MNVESAAARVSGLNFLIYAAHATSGLVIPLYAAQVGASVDVVGVIGGVYGLAAFLASLIFGRAGDRFDRRSVLIVGFGIAVAGFLLQLAAFSPATLMVARFAAGFAFGAIPPTLAAYVFEIKRPLGRFSSFNALGFLFGSLVIALLGATALSRAGGAIPTAFRAIDALQVTFLISVLLVLVGWTLAPGVPSMRMGHRVPLFPWTVIRRNSTVFVSVLLRHVGAHSVWIIFPLYIIELGGDFALVGWVTVVNMVTQITVMRSVERFPRLRSGPLLLGLGLLLSSLTILSFGLVENAWQLLPLNIPLGVSFAFLWLGSLKTVLESNVERGTAAGLLNGSFMLSQVVGPVLGGIVAELYGFRTLFVAAASVGIIGFVAFLLGRKPHEYRAEEIGPREPAAVNP